MKDLGKKDLLGVLIDAVDYEAAVERIIAAAEACLPLAVTALAAHGVMTGFQSLSHRYRLNRFDLVTPDGQPVRWAMNWLHRTALEDRVYGPTLMLHVCETAARQKLPIYLYGSQPEVIGALTRQLQHRFPALHIAGAEPSRFRNLSREEETQLIERIRASSARLVFVGLGCPRQEVFVYELRERLGMPLLAVGAAFDYHSGFAAEPPAWMQRCGLQWFHRLAANPTRLWRRYLLLNPIFLWRLTLQLSGLQRPDPADVTPPQHDLLCG